MFTDDDIMQGQHTLTALVASYYSGYTGVLGVRGCNYVCGGKRDDGSSFEHEGTRTTGYHKPDWHLGEEPLTESDIRLCSQGPDTTHFWPPSGSEVRRANSVYSLRLLDLRLIALLADKN